MLKIIVNTFENSNLFILKLFPIKRGKIYKLYGRKTFLYNIGNSETLFRLYSKKIHIFLKKIKLFNF